MMILTAGLLRVGVEKMISDQFLIGGSLSYTDITSTAPLAQTAEGSLLAATVYGQIRYPSDFVLQGQASLGTYHTETARNVAIAQNFALATSDNSIALGAEIGVAKEFKRGQIIFAPGIGARFNNINFGSVAETGGGPALNISREDYTSLQARAGFDVRGDNSSLLQAHFSAYAIHEFEDQPANFGANFVGGAGGLAPFALSSDDRDWFEVGGGLRFAIDDGVTIDLSLDSTIARSDVQSQTYQAGITVKF